MTMIDTLKNLNNVELFFVHWMGASIQYVVVSGIIFYLSWIYFKKRTDKLRISHPKDIKKQARFEIINSIIVRLNHTLPAIIFLKTDTWMANRVYFDFDKHSIGYYLGGLVFIFFLHDAYFYWTHRLFHHPKLLKWFHITHHKSREVTPFSTFSFHFVEGFVQILIVPIALIFMELHISTFGVFFFLSFLFNINGHIGMNLSTKNFRNKAPFKWFIFSTDHAQHHLRSHGNYGLYLKFWDKAMGTYIGEYGDRIK